MLQHPLYDMVSNQAAAGENSERWQLAQQSQQAELRVPLGTWEESDHYRDPLAAAAGQFPAAREFDRHWLAGRLPVKVHGKTTGLFAIVQENHDQMIAAPLAQMRRGLVLLSLVTLGLSAAAIVPLWGVILRLVR